MKQPLIRIGDALIDGPRLTVELRFRNSLPCIVESPQEARQTAAALADTSGGRIYRGRLPAGWHAALSDYPRS